MMAGSILSAAAGFGLFLLGMSLLGRALAGAESRFFARPGSATGHPVRGLLAGLGATVLCQSSSAVTALLVRLVQSDRLGPRQALPALLGSNLGTTLTPWLLLAGLRLRPAALWWLPPLWGLAVLFCPRPALRRGGLGVGGFLLLFLGLSLLCRAARPLCSLPLLSALPGGSPLWVFAGAAGFTAVVQSGTAVLGLLQGGCTAGLLPLGRALAAVAGINVGTCSTALLAAAGRGEAARQVAAAHLRFNLLGSTAALLLCGVLSRFFPGPAARPVSAMGLAALHSGFNLVAVLLVWPRREQLLLGAKKPPPAQRPKAAEC